MKTGDVVLIAFPFTNSVGVKKRPALVIFDSKDGDLILARITSKKYQTNFDIEVSDWKSAGLLSESTIRLHKLATLEASMVATVLGKLSTLDFDIFLNKIKDLMIDNLPPFD